MRDGVKSLDELLELLHLQAADVGASAAAAKGFPLRVPRGFVQRMEPGRSDDPLLLQVLPAAAELERLPGFVADPLAEEEMSPLPGLLHKYRGRALLVTTGACAIHCRYCFRRHFPYSEHATDWRPAIEYIRRDASITEVLLSGGDPLALSDDKLGRLVGALAEIGHVRRLRVHTRLPVVLPSRIDTPLLDWLTGFPALKPIVVIHANHPRELEGDVGQAMKTLGQAGVVLLNQSVLLRGVNDSVAVLGDLSDVLFECGVMPYYLHVLDRVAGAAHFDVPEAEALRLIQGLAGELPGYLVPKLVREVPGADSKTSVLLPSA